MRLRSRARPRPLSGGAHVILYYFLSLRVCITLLSFIHYVYVTIIHPLFIHYLCVCSYLQEIIFVSDGNEVEDVYEDRLTILSPKVKVPFFA